MRGLPSNLRLCLLDHNPMPSLAEMMPFVQCFRAVHQSDIDVTSAHAVQSLESVDHPNSSHLPSSILDLTAVVDTLTAYKRELCASLASPPAQQEPHRHLSRTSAHSDVRGWGKPPNFLPELLLLAFTDVATIAICLGISPMTALGTHSVHYVLGGATLSPVCK